jgi:hypothetical protein
MSDEKATLQLEQAPTCSTGRLAPPAVNPRGETTMDPIMELIEQAEDEAHTLGHGYKIKMAALAREALKEWQDTQEEVRKAIAIYFADPPRPIECPNCQGWFERQLEAYEQDQAKRRPAELLLRRFAGLPRPGETKGGDA